MRSKKMRIMFFITGLQKSGAETQMYNLISGLVKRKNVEVKVISLIGGYFERKLRKLGVEVNVSRKNKMNLISHIRFFKREVREFKPDIVHSFLFHANIFSKAALFFMRKDFKLICSYRDITSSYRGISIAERVNMKKADMLISNSKAANEDLSRYRVKGRRMVISNSFMPKKIDREKARKLKDYYKKKGNKVVLTVANFRDQKDYLTNLRACEALSHIRNDFVFLYVGKGEDFEKIKEEAASKNLKKYIKFLGRRHDVIELLSVSDVFFLPTLHESQCNALMEAMYMKIPIVTTSIRENRELVRHGEFCRKGDHICMMKAINNIFNYGYSKEELNHNYRFVKDELSQTNMVKKYMKAYESLLNKKGTRY